MSRGQVIEVEFRGGPFDGRRKWFKTPLQSTIQLLNVAINWDLIDEPEEKGEPLQILTHNYHLCIWRSKSGAETAVYRYTPLQRRIIQKDRFVTYEHQDMEWAEPLGLAKWSDWY